MKDRKPFRFKQFEIFQDKTAMKVGTDGVLLGAWSNLYSGNRILDIGTGTGLISLMLAQRFSEAIIDAIELDEDAYVQAKENALNSIFFNKITIYHTALQNYQPSFKYDLIVSNPPFFVVNDRIDFNARKQARQQETLTFDELLEKSSLLLNDKGRAAFIIPFDLEKDFIEIGEKYKLYPSKILNIRGNQNVAFKRSIIELSFEKLTPETEELVIEEDRHQYTEEYIHLTKDFYLKM